jgi:hypothetical protein
MPIPFGFSVGDFIATLELIQDVVEALKESHGSSADFQELIRELYSLERALSVVKKLEVSPAQHSQLDAVKQAATQCQITVDTFLRKNKKFLPTLGAAGAQHKWKGVLHKIQWRVYRKDDVDEFRAALSGHTSSINMLLLTVQMYVSWRYHVGTSLISPQAIISHGEISERRELPDHNHLI